MSYPEPFETDLATHVAKPLNGGPAPIHIGFFEAGWKAATEAAARLLDPPDEDSLASDEDLAAYAVRASFAEQVRELGVYTEDWWCDRCGDECERHRPASTTGSDQ